jgi:hypothetical protein
MISHQVVCVSIPPSVSLPLSRSTDSKDSDPYSCGKYRRAWREALDPYTWLTCEEGGACLTFTSGLIHRSGDLVGEKGAGEADPMRCKYVRDGTGEP